MRNNLRPVSNVLVACILLVLTACASLTKSWQAPEVSLVGLQPKQIGLTQQSFLANLRVKNPNDRTLPIKGMTYRLYLEGNEIANGSSELDRQIPAFGEQAVDVEVNSSLLGLMQQVPALMLKKDDVNWKIAGTIGIAGGLIRLPYSYSGDIAPQDLMSAMTRYR